MAIANIVKNNELDSALAKANGISNEYFRLRALAVLSLLRLSGKRRTEIAWIPLESFKVGNDLLNVTFALEKEKAETQKCPGCSTKNPVASSFCKNCGLGISQVPITVTSKQAKSLKAFRALHFRLSMPSTPQSSHIVNYFLCLCIFNTLFLLL
jgi:hypothetical protein